jgi:hypothetical protein
MGGSMRADKIFTVTAAVAATALASLVTVPSAGAQAPKEAVHHHPPAKVTVHRRAVVDPAVENRRRSEYYHLYEPEYGRDPMRNSTLFMNGPSLPFYHDRMPFPTCLDLPGFCQEP